MKMINPYQKNKIVKSWDTGNYARDRLLERNPQDGLFTSELSSSSRDIKFSEQEFPAIKAISNIKYHHLSFQNNNFFYLFNNQLDFTLVNYFAQSETIKGNIDKYLSDSFMFPLTKKLSYQNTDIQMEKLSDILWGISNNK